MNTAKVFNLNASKLHLINTDRYTRVSRAKTLCGLPGKKVWRPMAAWFDGCAYCKTCVKRAK